MSDPSSLFLNPRTLAKVLEWAVNNDYTLLTVSRNEYEIARLSTVRNGETYLALFYKNKHGVITTYGEGSRLYRLYLASQEKSNESD